VQPGLFQQHQIGPLPPERQGVLASFNLHLRQSGEWYR
jgi:hypothetical protein